MHMPDRQASDFRVRSAALCALLLAACVAVERAPQSDGNASVVASSTPTSIPQDAAASAGRPTAPGTHKADSAADAARSLGPAAAPTVPVAAARAAATSPAPTAATPAPAASRPAATASAAKSEAPALAIAKADTPPLDLQALERRLKETKAIGVFTKLTLKNQVDDLLDRFRSFYQGQLKTSLAELRRSYDLLVLKVLALLQDADPALASAIATSRESIWGILSNPAKFSKI